ncbi:MAG: thiamine pyrophosphate-dependent enzyme [Thermoplasmatota archaeon]
MMEQIDRMKKNLREDSLPHFFCPGCGAGQVMNFFLRAADELDLDFDNLVGVGGVGCTARIPVYLKCDALHGIHGRVFPWATGIKLKKPDLDVVVFAGDGGIGAIGGNHFIQAARRNLDITTIIVNNLNFAMTGGQVSPTTPSGMNTTTTPFGNKEEKFDLKELHEAAGGTFYSRWTTGRSNQAIKSIKEALKHKGFSVVEIIAQCPTHFGRYALGTGKPVNGINWIDEKSVTISEAEDMTEDELKDRFIIGDFYKKDKPVFDGSTVYEEGD